MTFLIVLFLSFCAAVICAAGLAALKTEDEADVICARRNGYYR